MAYTQFLQMFLRLARYREQLSCKKFIRRQLGIELLKSSSLPLPQHPSSDLIFPMK